MAEFDPTQVTFVSSGTTEADEARARLRARQGARKAADLTACMAEEALFAEKERAQVTLNSIGDAVLTTDVDGTVTYLNLVAETMTGWARDEALGQPLAEVFHIVDGISRETARNPARLAMSEDRVVGLAAGCVLLRRDGVELNSVLSNSFGFGGHNSALLIKKLD